MNYIKHLTAVFEVIDSDNRLTPFHISLYMTLFRCWNLNFFHNPVSISRDEMMKMAKIGSVNTYVKCLKELHSWNYIRYEPSYNRHKGSMVYLYTFDNSTDNASDMPVRPSINNIKYINNKTFKEGDTHAQNPEIEICDSEKNGENLEPDKDKKAKRKKVAPKKEKVFVAPNLDDALAFFKAEQYPEIEARKFFYHFEANGWKVGGKTPMKNWNAAAHNWMLNTSRYEPEPKQNAVKLNTRKDYGEPL